MNDNSHGGNKARKRLTALTRRAFLAAATTSAVTVVGGCASRPNSARVVPGKQSPNERLNIAAIGAGGKGMDDIRGCRSENLVALCDPDWNSASQAFARYPAARRFRDYREMLDAMPEIDACTISTPDHTHAPAAWRAMRLGKHVYVQKPLTYTVAEASLLQKTARDMNVATQMGNQGHSLESVPALCELLWSGAIGTVGEIHAWTDRPVWPQGMEAALPGKPIPDTLDWDIWLGCAPERPYHPGYAPFVWRGWRDFGTGALGDMACHVLDGVWTALKLGLADHYTVEPVLKEGLTSQSYPRRSTLKYSVPERADFPPCDLYWYDGFLETAGQKIYNRPAGFLPSGSDEDDKNGCLFCGSRQSLITGAYGQKPRLAGGNPLPPVPENLPRIPQEDHYRDWIQACKHGKQPSSSFEYSAPFTQMVLLGNIALAAGCPIHFDARRKEVTNLPGARSMMTREYRAGHELPIP